MALQVIQAGLFTTIQDLGRPGRRRWGVPEGGVFDRGSAKIANALLGNDWTDSVLEFTTLGGIYEAEAPLALALAGAPFRAEIQHASGSTAEAPIASSFRMTAGDRLVIGGPRFGARAYLAVEGGWRTPVILGSRSTETRLVSGDRLDAGSSATAVRRLADAPLRFESLAPLRYINGPDPFPGVDLNGLVYRVLPDSNRMGLRLEGPVLNANINPERLSAPVARGSIQLAGGLPMILGAAGGTLGGYPHVGQIISADLDRLAQVAGGDDVRFDRVTLAEARKLDRSSREASHRRLIQIRGICIDRPGK